MRKRIYQKMFSVYFYIGVNVLGMPEMHTHDVLLFKTAKYTL